MEAGLMRWLERYVILQVVDTRWREHLENMEYLREGVHLRAMAQKDPLVEYRAEGHVMFEELSLGIHEEVVSILFHAQLAPEDASTIQALQQAEATDGDLSYQHESIAGADAIAAAGAEAGALADGRRCARGRRHQRRDRSARHVGAREARPQRPLLVRLGQEVQEVPRRVTRRALAESARQALLAQLGDGRLGLVQISESHALEDRTAPS